MTIKTEHWHSFCTNKTVTFYRPPSGKFHTIPINRLEDLILNLSELFEASVFYYKLTESQKSEQETIDSRGLSM